MSAFLDRVVARALGTGPVAHRRREPVFAAGARAARAVAVFDEPSELERAPVHEVPSMPRTPRRTANLRAETSDRTREAKPDFNVVVDLHEESERGGIAEGADERDGRAADEFGDRPSETERDAARRPAAQRESRARREGSTAAGAGAQPALRAAEHKRAPRAAHDVEGVAEWTPRQEDHAFDHRFEPSPARTAADNGADERRSRGAARIDSASASAASDDNLTINVSIGSIEIARPVPAVAAPAPAWPAPRSSLEDYLRMRAKVRGR